MLMYATAEDLLPMPRALENMHVHPSSWAVALLSVGNVMAGYGASFSTVACMVVIVKNFPHRRGTIVGIVKCITGLSGGMYAQIYMGFLAPRTLSFVLMAAVSNLVLNFSMAFFLPVVPADPHEKNLDLRLSLAMAMVILLTMGILAAACAAHFFPQNDGYLGSWSGSGAGEDGPVWASCALEMSVRRTC
jgi:MFS family permease